MLCAHEEPAEHVFGDLKDKLTDIGRQRLPNVGFVSLDSTLGPPPSVFARLASRLYVWCRRLGHVVLAVSKIT